MRLARFPPANTVLAVIRFVNRVWIDGGKQLLVELVLWYHCSGYPWYCV